MKKHFLYCILCLSGIIGWMACAPVYISGRTDKPSEYNLCYEEVYGRCYDSIPHAVVALDLYSEGLCLDSAYHKMQGTGYNLYLSDIFLPDRSGTDSLHLAPGTYHSDTTAAPYTFLPGRDWEGTPAGMYLLYVEEGKLQSIQVIDSGLMVVRDTTNALTDLQFTLYYTYSDGSRATYEAHFQGPIDRHD